MQAEYIKRINKVLIYLDAHLDDDLSLRNISKIAYYSPFHLHRLFKAITNETLNTYITRKRIERTALMLIHNNECTIKEIAEKFGFKNDTTYSRTFKKIYGQSPTSFRKKNLNTFSKIRKVNSNIGKGNYFIEEYVCNINHLLNWIKMNAKIEIKELPTMNFSFVTQIGVNGIEDSFQKVIKWARTKEILGKPNTYIARMFHDSFKITDAEKVRMSIGLLTQLHLAEDGELEQTSIDTCKNIVGRFEMEPIEFEKAWNSLFIWMNDNGYKKADVYPMEIYHNNFNEHPEKKCVVDLCIPVK